MIQDVVLSKLHSAILTTDPESNLYMCGFGPGGRLGTGDEVTRFTYTCIEEGGLAGKRIIKVALGQNHTLAVSSEGEIFSWGTSTYSQLGYSLPRPNLGDEELVLRHTASDLRYVEARSDYWCSSICHPFCRAHFNFSILLG